MKNFIIRNKNIIIDLVIFGLITLISVVVVVNFNSQLRSLTGILDVFITPMAQFSIAGLGAVIVMFIRKEKFTNYRFVRSNIIKPLLLGLASVVAFLIYTYFTNGGISWMPFKQVHETSVAFRLQFPLNVIGLTLIAIAWGFFEGFTWIFASQKINSMFNIRNPFLRPAALGVIAVNIIIHASLGQNIDLKWIASSIITYIVITIPELTKNSWGSIVIFFGLWNALW